VSNNPFENKIAAWLSDPSYFAYHPPDYSGHFKIWAPADFLVLTGGVFTAIECKSVATGSTFPLSRWTPQQRQSLARVVRAGGHYVLLVQYEQFRTITAFRPDPTPARGSLDMTGGRQITKQTFHTILDGSL
jgi:hypothetical protein